VLHRSEIVENATTERLFEQPQNDYTRELLVAIPLPDPDQHWF
jgi:peptide/nickel transport system ATP-binding protein